MTVTASHHASRPDIDFLIIGATKSSTTWLQATLQQAPDVVMPDPELHFFSRHYDNGFDWYGEQFPAKAPGQIMGEKSNSYLTDPEAAARIQSAYPDIRLVVMLRNPVSRAYSDYCMLYRRGTVDKNIGAYLDPDRANFRRFVDDGLYARHLQTYFDLFPKGSIQIHFFEESRQDPQAVLDRLANHLGRSDGWLVPHDAKVKDRSAAMVPRPMRKILKPLRPLLDPVRNTAPIKSLRGFVAKEVNYPKMSKALTDKLTTYYEADVNTLENLCGRPLTGWLHDGRV